jgi:hypothetical protein
MLFPGRRTKEYGLSDRQPADASDRAADSSVVPVGTNDSHHPEAVLLLRPLPSMMFSRSSATPQGSELERRVDTGGRSLTLAPPATIRGASGGFRASLTSLNIRKLVRRAVRSCSEIQRCQQIFILFEP